MSKQYLKYGGVRFINHATPREINHFVNNLSEEDRYSLFSVVSILEQEGLISIVEDDATTVDQSMEKFLVPNN